MTWQGAVAMLEGMPFVAMVCATVMGAVFALAALVWAGRRTARGHVAAARAGARAMVRGAQREAAALRRAAHTRGREEALLLREQAERDIAAGTENLASRGEDIERRAAAAEERHAEVDQRRALLDERFAALKERRERASDLLDAVDTLRAEARCGLEKRAGVSAQHVIAQFARTWREEARARAAQALRNAEQGYDDTEVELAARRLMEIAAFRYKNHFLTERNVSRLPLPAPVAELLREQGGAVQRGLEQVGNVQLHLSDEDDCVRLEGLDGVGREVARRALNRLEKKPQAGAEARGDPLAWAQKIRDQLDQEIAALGKKAFAVLEIPRAHREIIQLVGALNYRTSYTQNQWLHAVEASFLCGMMAEELGLDVKLARRATLLHDIGKALTHEQEGSHAVIGADIARRLGEDEIVANAIGAHHLDEPMNSSYAYLVAAADAMSGARPGARREFSEDYSNRLQDLERIGRSHRGVDRAHAVHGGRELRVYVREAEVSDLEAAQLSSAIADQVGEEMVFPGQIKVTVIRAFEAVSVAS